MKKNGKNEELQSRREFFKRAAKGALPILAGAALLSSPILSETANAMSCAGCNNRCMNSCFNTLKSYIYNSVAELRLKKQSFSLKSKSRGWKKNWLLWHKESTRNRWTCLLLSKVSV